VLPILKEAQMLMSWEDRHRRLLGRIGLVFFVTLLADLLGAAAIYFLERHAQGSEVHTFGVALFFSTVQLLTVSSQIKNPVTTSGRVIDVMLEIWAVIVVAGSAGAIASFFSEDPRTGESS
jgi:hypothetical protein